MMSLIDLRGGLRCVNFFGDFVPVFASSSASSFPSCPLCPGIQFRQMLFFWFANLMRFSWHIMVEVVFIVVKSIALMAACESLYITTFLFSMFNSNSLRAVLFIA